MFLNPKFCLCFFVLCLFLCLKISLATNEEIILDYPPRLDPVIRTTSKDYVNTKNISKEKSQEKERFEMGKKDDGIFFRLTEGEMRQFLEEGYSHLGGFLSPSEISEIETVFDSFILGEISAPGKDFCDMSQPLSTPMDQWRLVNAMLPRIYYPAMQNTTFEKKALSVARQLLGNDMEIDYDQFLMKKEARESGVSNGAKFSWHQDLSYWPKDTPDYRTVTISLALNDANVENGCLMVIPKSGKEKKLRNHIRLGEGTEDVAHTLEMQLEEKDTITYIPLRAGDVSIHDERIVHGSGGNSSTKRVRKTYVLAFRSKDTIKYERSIGFTHSHNDFQPPINEEEEEEKEEESLAEFNTEF